MTEDQKAALDRSETKAMRILKEQRDKLKKTCAPFAAAAAAEIQAAFEADFKKDLGMMPDIGRSA